MANSAQARIRLLGRVSIHDRGAVTNLPVGAVGAVFARLVLEPGARVSANELIELLWVDESPSTARHALAVHVSMLRRALVAHGSLAGAVHGERSGYRIEVDDTEVDALLVRRAALPSNLTDPDRAMRAHLLVEGLWSGDPFAGIVDRFPGLQQYDRELRRARSSVAVAAARTLLERHDTTGAIAMLQPAVRFAPTNEALLLLLMRALVLAGNRDQALDAYREGVRALSLAGLAVSDELKQAQRAVSVDDPTLLPLSHTAARPEARKAGGDVLKEVADLAARYSVSLRLPTAAHVRELDSRRGDIRQGFAKCEADLRWETLLSLALGLRVYWWVGGWIAPGLRWLLLGLGWRGANADQVQRGRYYVAQLAESVGNLPLACASAETSLALARESGETLSEAWTLVLLARLDRRRRQHEESAARLASAHERFDAHEDAPGVAAVLSELAVLALQRGAVDEAIAAANDARAIAQTTGQARVLSEAALAQAVVHRVDGNNILGAEAAQTAARQAIACGDRLLLPRALLTLAEMSPDVASAERMRGAAAAVIHATGARTAEDSYPAASIWEPWTDGWTTAATQPHVPWLDQPQLEQLLAAS
jgi:DNA-binding SARP family transcriptional activator